MSLRVLLSVFFLSMSSGFAAEPAGQDKPNIVMILADDLGYGDLKAFNEDTKVPTPNLDALGKEGIRFTTAYCPVSVCSPSRYALMTGAYPWRSWNKRGVLGNWDKSMIQEKQLTLPAMLRNAGYLTAGFGKWHLGAKYETVDGKKPNGQGKFKSPGNGDNIDLSKPVTGGPLDRGFDLWKGMICSSEMLIFDGKMATGRLHHELYEPLKIPGIDRLPAVPVEELLPRTTRESVEFLNEQGREKQKPFFLYFASYVPHIPLAVAPEFRGKTKAGDYGDYVHELDHHIGVLLEALKTNGFADNTIVIFASDNGSQWPVTGEDHHPNGKLAGTKWKIEEGGVRTPLLVRWPGKITADTSSDALIALNDVIATLAAVTGQTLPADAAPDSFNQLPLLLGKPPESPIRKEVLLQASEPHFALREGNWKYVKRGGKEAPKEALYDLAADPAETKDLSATEPARLAAMSERFRVLFKAERTAP